MFKFGILGLCNFASLITLYVVAFVININQKFIQIPIETEEIAKEKKSINFENYKWPVIGLVTAVLAIFFMIFFNTSGGYYYGIFSLLAVLVLLFIMALPILVAIIIFILGYRKDKHITKFAICFTVVFIILSIITQIIIRAFTY